MTKIKPQTKHLIGLDLLRFFAALAVVGFHLIYITSADTGGRTYAISNGEIHLPDFYSFTRWGWVGVQIFFVISGFVIAASAEKSTASKFFIGRVTRLLPAVWICAPITFLILEIGLNENAVVPLIKSLIFFPMGPWMDGSYWTLGIEIAFYALIFALVFFEKFRFIRIFAIIIGLTSGCFWVIYTLFLLNPDSSSALIMDKLAYSRKLQLLLVHHGYLFSIGILIWMNTRKNELLNWLFIGIFLFIGLLEIHNQNQLVNRLFEIKYSFITPFIIWFMAMIFMVWSTSPIRDFSQFPPSFLRGCRALGLMTYPLYLFHQIIGAYISGLLAGHGMPDGYAVLIAIAICLLSSYMIAIVIEPVFQQKTKYALESIFNRNKNV